MATRSRGVHHFRRRPAPTKGGPDFWRKHPDRETVLKALWEIKRAAWIAEVIGHGCTKNMVIGKAKRLGLPDISDAERSRRCSEVNRDNAKLQSIKGRAAA